MVGGVTSRTLIVTVASAIGIVASVEAVPLERGGAEKARGRPEHEAISRAGANSWPAVTATPSRSSVPFCGQRHDFHLAERADGVVEGGREVAGREGQIRRLSLVDLVTGDQPGRAVATWTR